MFLTCFLQVHATVHTASLTQVAIFGQLYSYIEKPPNKVTLPLSQLIVNTDIIIILTFARMGVIRLVFIQLPTCWHPGVGHQTAKGESWSSPGVQPPQKLPFSILYTGSL